MASKQVIFNETNAKAVAEVAKAAIQATAEATMERP